MSNFQGFSHPKSASQYTLIQEWLDSDIFAVLGNFAAGKFVAGNFAADNFAECFRLVISPKNVLLVISLPEVSSRGNFAAQNFRNVEISRAEFSYFYFSSYTFFMFSLEKKNKIELLFNIFDNLDLLRLM